jgi:hypothetical protein
LNVFADWQPKLTPSARQADVLFLAAMDPDKQRDVRRQWEGAKWSALDTQAYWIATKRAALVEAISEVDIVLMNDQEARALTQTPVLLQAARTIVSWGPRVVVLKLGEYGCALLTEDGYFSLPGYPLEELTDPTGTGDAFAGAFLGYLDLVPRSALTEEVVRRAVTYGSVMASFCVEEFGARRLAGRSQHEIRYRLEEFVQMTHFEHVPTVPHPHELAPERPVTLERPAPTAGTRSIPAPSPTAATPAYRSPERTPSNGQFAVPNRPPPELFR